MNKVMRLFSVSVVLATIAVSVPSIGAQAATVNLVVIGGSSGDVETNALNVVIANWNKANPGIQAKFIADPNADTTVAKDLASGNPPDIFYVDSSKLLDLVKAGALAPIGNKIDNYQDIYQSLRDVFTVNGQFYCPPKDFSTLALQVNNDMLAAAGIKAPPKTWDEFAADAKLLTTKDVVGTITPNDPARWLAFLYQAGGTLTDASFSKMTVNNAAGLKALKFYTDLYINGYAKKPADVGAGWPGEAFEKGKAAMIFEGNWLLGDAAKNAPNLKYSSVPLPTVDAASKPQSMVFTVCYGVAAHGKNVDAATKLVNFLVNANSMKSFTDTVGVMPARQSLAAGWLAKYPDFKVYLDAANYSHRWGFAPGFQPVLDDIAKQIDLVFQSQTTAEDALKEIEQTGNSILAGNPPATAAPTMSSAVNNPPTGAPATTVATMAATMMGTMAPTMSGTMAPTMVGTMAPTMSGTMVGTIAATIAATP